MLKEAIIQYPQLYKDGYVSGVSEEENRRIMAQARISEFISKNPGNEDVQNYLNNVQLPPRNTGIKPNPWIPHIDEAVYSTLVRMKVAKEINRSIAPHSKVHAVFGSANWGAFYSTQRTSDLDLEVIVDKLSPDMAELDIFEGHKERLSEAFQITIDRDIDMLLYEMPFQGVPIMYHFISTEKFKNLTENLELQDAWYQRSYSELVNNFHRFDHMINTTTGLLEFSDRCNFDDERRTWHARHENITGDFHLLNLPVYQVEDGKLYNGLFPEWHLTHPYVLGGDRDWFNHQSTVVFTEFVRRWAYEESTQGNRTRFSNILERKHRMPMWLLDEFDVKAERLKIEMNL